MPCAGLSYSRIYFVIYSKTVTLSFLRAKSTWLADHLGYIKEASSS